MFSVYALFLIPTLLFVVAFLYETFLAFRRLFVPKLLGNTGYLSATWEVTHTLLIFAVVMLLMLFTGVIDQLTASIFTPTFLAAVFLTIRVAAYMQIFYVRRRQHIGWLDWLFALSHVGAALLLVVTVLKSVWFVHQHGSIANTQFIPYFIPGLVIVLATCALPILSLYKTKH
jgi:cytochrome bd-type quinol oxidase subunit 2